MDVSQGFCFICRLCSHDWDCSTWPVIRLLESLVYDIWIRVLLYAAVHAG